ncbi:hypothetical protein IW492_02080 [Enterococcus sp. BWB1-3]|uniref:hypothetical protein n=1 Tax=Enterococcus sp. BWB1-3 TaxID=2787713 RepID=UPI001922B23E|nr:hypothetical protein [Enterococcus sp. BWB1-3]MBL1228018.1 hypothetical protein [Enterococcus sp. BWB1-3]
MDELKIKAEKITNELIKFCSAVEVNGRILNLNNAIQTVEQRIELRFEGLEDKQEAIELVKIWISDEESVQKNWDVAFLLSRYQVEDTYTIQNLSMRYLGLDTSDKNKLYDIFGLLSMRYVDYEVRKRLLRFYRKAYSTRTFFKKSNQTIKVDNVQEEITKEGYLLLLNQDLQHLEDKFRVPIAHKEGKELEQAWKKYQTYLSITYYIVLWREQEEKRLIPILENVSGIPYNPMIVEEFGEKLKEVNLVLYQNHFVSDYQLYLFYVTTVLESSENSKDKTILNAIKQAGKWMLEYEVIENKLSSLSNKEAQRIDCLTVFFPNLISKFLGLKEADGKRYELTVLYKESLVKSSSKSTKQRRTDGVKKRSEFLNSKKASTKNSGDKIYQKLLKGYSIAKVSKEFQISRETAYKHLYAYYFKIFSQERKKKENTHLNEKELLEIVCEKYKFKENHLLNAIKRYDNNN